MLFPHIQSYNEQNFETFHDSDTTDMIQIDLHTSYDNSEFDVNLSEDRIFDEDQSIMFDTELFESVNLRIIIIILHNQNLI